MVSTIQTMSLVEATMVAWLEGRTEEFYFQGINSLTEECHECIELCSDYILENELYLA